MLIRLYQYIISPWLVNRCRFEPTCSHYAILSIKYHGVMKGLWLTCCRLSRCHPWAPGGVDPVVPFTKEKI